MDKPGRYKAKNKKPPPKPKNAKRKKSDGPTCSMFLSELSRKLAIKKRQEEESPANIVQTIIDSITNALPFVFSRKTPEKKDSPMEIENLQTLAPELLPNDTLDVPGPVVGPVPVVPESEVLINQIQANPRKGFKVPKMPVVTSEVFKLANQRNVPTVEVAVNTGGDHDVASEIAKHVVTLKRISLIAEEFNQKTAKNLKEIVDSVQEDLIKKLEEIQAEQKMTKIEETMQVEQNEGDLAEVSK